MARTKTAVRIYKSGGVMTYNAVPRAEGNAVRDFQEELYYGRNTVNFKEMLVRYMKLNNRSLPNYETNRFQTGYTTYVTLDGEQFCLNNHSCSAEISQQAGAHAILFMLSVLDSLPAANHVFFRDEEEEKAIFYSRLSRPMNESSLRLLRYTIGVNVPYPEPEFECTQIGKKGNQSVRCHLKLGDEKYSSEVIMFGMHHEKRALARKSAVQECLRKKNLVDKNFENNQKGFMKTDEERAIEYLLDMVDALEKEEELREASKDLDIFVEPAVVANEGDDVLPCRDYRSYPCLKRGRMDVLRHDLMDYLKQEKLAGQFRTYKRKFDGQLITRVSVFSKKPEGVTKDEPPESTDPSSSQTVKGSDVPVKEDSTQADSSNSVDVGVKIVDTETSQLELTTASESKEDEVKLAETETNQSEETDVSQMEETDISQIEEAEVSQSEVPIITFFGSHGDSKHVAVNSCCEKALLHYRKINPNHCIGYEEESAEPNLDQDYDEMVRIDKKLHRQNSKERWIKKDELIKKRKADALIKSAAADSPKSKKKRSRNRNTRGPKDARTGGRRDIHTGRPRDVRTGEPWDICSNRPRDIRTGRPMDTRTGGLRDISTGGPRDVREKQPLRFNAAPVGPMFNEPVSKPPPLMSVSPLPSLMSVSPFRPAPNPTGITAPFERHDSPVGGAYMRPGDFPMQGLPHSGYNNQSQGPSGSSRQQGPPGRRVKPPKGAVDESRYPKEKAKLYLHGYCRKMGAQGPHYMTYPAKTGKGRWELMSQLAKFRSKGNSPTLEEMRRKMLPTVHA